jgi:hypothetical protein
MDIQDNKNASLHTQRYGSYRDRSSACAVIAGLGTVFYYAYYKQLQVTGKLLATATLISAVATLRHSRIDLSQQAKNYQVIKVVKDTGTTVALVHTSNGKLDLTEEMIEEILASGEFSKLRVEGFRITDKHIKQLFNLPKLESLGLSGVEIVGEELENLSAVSTLKVLDLNGATITDCQVKHLLASVPQLECLDLMPRTLLTDTGVENLKELKDLKVLRLEGQKQLTPEMIKNILLSLTKLEKLNLSSTLVNDEALSEIAQLTQLKELLLKKTEMTDVTLKKISRLKHLEGLSIRGTPAKKMNVTDEGILEVVNHCEKLCVLTIMDTQITEKCVGEIRKKRPKLLLTDQL